MNKQHTLSTRITWSICAALLTYFLAMMIWSYLMFREAEIKERIHSYDSAAEFIYTVHNKALSDFSAINTDYAHWDDTHAYMNGSDDEFITVNFDANAMTTLGIEVAFFFNKDNKLQKMVAPSAKYYGLFQPLADALDNALIESDSFFYYRGSMYSYAISDIRLTGGLGSINGYLIFVKRIQAEATDIVAKTFNVTAKIELLGENEELVWINPQDKYKEKIISSERSVYILGNKIAMNMTSLSKTFLQKDILINQMIGNCILFILFSILLFVPLRVWVFSPFNYFVSWVENINLDDANTYTKTLSVSRDMRVIQDKLIQILKNQKAKDERQINILNSISDVIIIVGQDGIITYANKSAVAWFEEPSDVLIGHSLFQWIGLDETKETIYPLFASCQATGKSATTKLSGIKYSGMEQTPFYVEIKISPVYVADGDMHPTQNMLIIRDIDD